MRTALLILLGAAIASAQLPAGFRPLFNGKDLTGWHISQVNHHGNTRGFAVENGVLLATQDKPGNGGILLTDRRFGDFEISLEVKPDWGCDSGLFLRSSEKGEAYQVMLDYLEGGNIGGIYGEALDAMNQPGAGTGKRIDKDWRKHWKNDDWNLVRARIEGEAPHIQVWLNGVQLVDWTDSANHAAGGARDGMIALQVHGGTRWVPGGYHRFRNIGIRELNGDFPQASISNGVIAANLYLPDAERGYYRGTRFDWSGVVSSLRCHGHEYFGQWFPRYDPKLHDAIMGPVEEFVTAEGSSIGYAEAKPGGTFLRIGVGTLRKPDERAFQRFATYDIVDPGKWTVRQAADSIEFRHVLGDETGYAYEYTKSLRLAKDRPELVIEHTLRNTGRKPIETLQYNHNFFMIDHQPTGPDVSITFPFALRQERDMKPHAEIQGNRLAYLRELQPGESAYSGLEGFAGGPGEYDIRIENRRAGAGVRIRGDRPLAKVYFWSIPTTACPEPYVRLRVEPGREEKWAIRYEFYTLR